MHLPGLMNNIISLRIYLTRAYLAFSPNRPMAGITNITWETEHLSGLNWLRPNHHLLALTTSFIWPIWMPMAASNWRVLELSQRDILSWTMTMNGNDSKIFKIFQTLISEIPIQ